MKVFLQCSVSHRPWYVHREEEWWWKECGFWRQETPPQAQRWGKFPLQLPLGAYYVPGALEAWFLPTRMIDHPHFTHKETLYTVVQFPSCGGSGCKHGLPRRLQVFLTLHRDRGATNGWETPRTSSLSKEHQSPLISGLIWKVQVPKFREDSFPPLPSII